MDVTVNYLAIFAASVAAMIIGGLWYSPLLFGNLWVKSSGLSAEKLTELKTRGMARRYIANYAAAFVTAFVHAHFAEIRGVADLGDAVGLAFWTWLGFIATTLLGAALWEGKTLAGYGINIAYHLVSLSVMALILTL
ncbi:MAG: DUF1761 domain-containing protein [Patescibacteria group bacterium]|nr:DUF1761 domain-containing protein [Patescibacteria group bacterium]